MSYIRCENLVKIYQNNDIETFALQGLNLIVQKGELMSIVGVSGSGKSTLMNVLGGLDRPSAGQVWVDQSNLLTMSDAELTRYRNSDVGFVWQQGSRNLIHYLSVLENVQLPMTLSGKTGRNKRQRAEDLLEAVGLSHRRGHRLSELSGGEQQRVAIAVALANEPKILLADEPTGELDTATALQIYEVFQNLNKQFEMTTIIVSHDPGIAQHVQRVVNIRDGQIATETVRRRRVNGASADSAEAEEEEHLEERTVLDAANRLHIPKEYLEQYEIERYVQIELIEEGILIKRAESDGDEEFGEDTAAEQKSATGLRGFLNRWRSREN